jgi:hypothetical protein
VSEVKKTPGRGQPKYIPSPLRIERATNRGQFCCYFIITTGARALPSLLPRQLLRASLLSTEVAAHPSESRWSHFHRCILIIFLLFEGLLRIDHSNVKMADSGSVQKICEMVWLLLLLFLVSFCLFCPEFQSRLYKMAADLW